MDRRKRSTLGPTFRSDRDLGLLELKMIDLLLQPIGASKSFQHRGKKYCLRPAGRRTLWLLRDVASSPTCQSTRGLLMLRPRIRKSLLYPTPVLLCRVIDTTRNTRVLRIGLWMLGRIGNRYATKSVAWQANHPFFPVRRDAIRTLHRLHAWTDLRRIAHQHQDPRTRRIAQPMSPPAHRDRLAAFVASRESIETVESEHPMVIDPQVRIGEGRLPKSPWRIAAVLRRIHHLVRRTRRGRRSFARGLRLRFRSN